MLKGHTLIELTDEKTGKKEVYEHDNMVTSAIEKELLNSKGLFMTPIRSVPIYYYNGLYRYENVRNLFGGLFLFHDPLTLDKDDYLIPYSNDMTGYGVYNIINSGNNIQLGSYSEVESGLQNDGSYKFVYNFDTSQANGQISSIALTPLISGKMSAGIKDECYSSQNYMDQEYISTFSSNDTVYLLTQGVLCYMDENYSYVIDKENFISSSNEFIGKNNKSLTIRKYSSPLGNMSIYDYTDKIVQEYGTYTIQIPEYTTMTNSISMTIQENYTYLIFREQDNQNSFKLHKLDIINKTCTTYNITLPNNAYFLTFITTNNNIFSLEYSINDYFCVVDNVFYGFVIPETNRNNVQLCYYNLITEEKGFIDDTTIKIDGDIHISSPYPDAKYFYIRINSKYYSVDCENKKIKRLNIKDSFGDFIFYRRIVKNCVFSVNTTSSSDLFGGKYFLKLNVAPKMQFLTTKNNLETPVTKTSSQSMKVTYTLTPA